MTEPRDNRTEVHRIRRMLRQTARLAKDASLTGTLEKGARTSVQQYNRTLQYLERIGEVPDGLFLPLPEEAVFDEVGIASWQLAGYLEGDEPHPAHPPHAPHPPAGGSHNNFSINVRGLEDLKDIGQVIRENFPDWMRGRFPGTEEAGEQNGGTLTEIESRLAEVGAKLQAVAEQLRRGDLSDAQRAELAEQLSRLGQEQARLARRHASLRTHTEAASD